MLEENRITPKDEAKNIKIEHKEKKIGELTLIENVRKSVTVGKKRKRNGKLGYEKKV